MRDLLCAVDVGSGSVRAGVCTADGRMLGRAQEAISTRRRGPDLAEQSSAEIWQATGRAVRAALAVSNVDAARVAGLAFDATCSLVAQRRSDAGGEGAEWDTIAWSDHRAATEAAMCTATNHRILSRLGGTMSPEMQIPKIMWLARSEPDFWDSISGLFDLADFLTWRATGSGARSHCTLTSKWCYAADLGGWQEDFLRQLGLGELRARAALPDTTVPVGGAIGRLEAAAASHLGLTGGCVVAAGLVDAFAGAIGTLAALEEPSRHAALIAGTSSCIICLSRDARQVPGAWGPYRDAAVPGFWAMEGGQSATGALLDHVIRRYGLVPDEGTHRRIAGRVEAAGAGFGDGLHVLPDFNGNRTPLADARVRGAAVGLDLDESFDGLCRLYWRSAVGLALGLRQIVEHLADHGVAIESLRAAGGHCCNPLLMQLYADALGLPVSAEPQGETVLRGTATAAALAAGLYPQIRPAAAAMQSRTRIYRPATARRTELERDYRIFLRMQRHRRELQEMSCT